MKLDTRWTSSKSTWLLQKKFKDLQETIFADFARLWHWLFFSKNLDIILLFITVSKQKLCKTVSGRNVGFFQVGLAVVNGQLYAVGGFDGSTYLKTVEVFERESNSWRHSGPFLLLFINHAVSSKNNYFA